MLYPPFEKHSSSMNSSYCDGRGKKKTKKKQTQLELERQRQRHHGCLNKDGSGRRELFAYSLGRVHFEFHILFQFAAKVSWRPCAPLRNDSHASQYRRSEKRLGAAFFKDPSVAGGRAASFLYIFLQFFV